MENEYFEYFELEGSQEDKRDFSEELTRLRSRSAIFSNLLQTIWDFARTFYPLSIKLVRGGHAVPADQKNLDKGQIQWVLDLDDLDALPQLDWDEKNRKWVLTSGVPDWAIFREAVIIHEIKKIQDYHIELEVNSRSSEKQLELSHESALQTENKFRSECGQALMRKHREKGKDPDYRWYLDDDHYVELDIDRNNNIKGVQYHEGRR